MNLKNTLHYASYMKWPFLISAVVLIFYSLIILPENLISVIGIIVFLIGIQIGFESLSDIERMSEKEKAFYQNKKNTKNLIILILSCTVITVTISLLFLSLKFIFASKNSPLFNELFNLGLDCWALILGLLCILKSVYDKHLFASESQKN